MVREPMTMQGGCAWLLVGVDQILRYIMQEKPRGLRSVLRQMGRGCVAGGNRRASKARRWRGGNQRPCNKTRSRCC